MFLIHSHQLCLNFIGNDRSFPWPLVIIIALLNCLFYHVAFCISRSIGPHSADGSCGGPEMGSSPPGIHYASIIDPSTLQGGQVASNNVPLPPPDENYIMMSPPPKNVAASGSSSKSSSLKRSTTGIAPPTGTSSSGKNHLFPIFWRNNSFLFWSKTSKTSLLY